MKKIRFTLRTKITLMFILISTLMCVVLSLSSMYSADKIMWAVPLTEAGKTADMSDEITVPKADYTAPIAITTEAKKSFQISTIYTMMGIIIIGATAIYILTGKALKPLETLNNAVKSQKPDDLASAMPLPSARDEVYELTSSFNERNSRLYEAYTMQKNFSANVAHELCTPLAVTQTKLDVFALKKDKNIDSYKALVEQIAQSNQRLTAIVESLLSITNSKDENLNQEVSLYDILEETLYELEDSIKEKEIICTLTGKKLIAHGNDTLLKQAVHNLVANAVRYNVQGGSILLSLYEKDSNICISVSDTGIGIPDNCKAHLFEPFYRVDKSRSRELGGSGLGLALVKKIVDLHEGVITVSDNTPQGSIFTIILNM